MPQIRSQRVFEVGKPYPSKVPAEGLLVSMHPSEGNNGLEVMFVLSVSDILRIEHEALIHEPIRFGILPYPPLVFLILHSNATTHDAPFGIGVNPPEFAIDLLRSARQPRAWPPATRRPAKLVVVDPGTAIIQGLREMTLTRDWWLVLAEALEHCPLELAREDYRAAMRRAYACWPETPAMLSDCAIIEEAGI